MSAETPYMKACIAVAGDYDLWLWRNNVGAWKTPSGQLVKYGLLVGSGDNIGLQRVTITPTMVGETFARFVSIEYKGPTGRPSPAQKQWRRVIQDNGGIALLMREGQHDPHEVFKALQNGDIPE